jgi:hypothetical protein
MIRNTALRRAGIAFLLCCALTLVAAGPATAQAGNDTAENQTAVDEEIQDQLGDLNIHEYSYSDGQFTIEATWKGVGTTRVTMTEMIELDSSGSTDISFERVRLVPGERTEITMAAEERSGGTAAILLTTPQGTQQGDALVLQSGSPTSYPSISFQNVLVAIGLTAIGAAGLVFVLVVRRKNVEEHGKEQIA